MAGEDIPLNGRIVSIADVFDALVSERPYKLAWNQAEAFEYIKNQSGLAFDPDIVQAFFSIQPEISKIVENLHD